jgi:hypothetical protein
VTRLRGTLEDLSTSGGRVGGSPRRRRFWPFGVGLAILVAVLAVFALQQGGDGGSGGPLNAIAEAAVKTQQAGGGRASVRGIISAPGQSKPLVLTGQVVYEDSGASRGTLTMPDPKSGDPVDIDFVQEGAQMYARSDLFGTLPEGRKWIGIDLSLGDEVEIGVPPGGDAQGELALLEKATGGVDKVGKEDVHGVPTTHYRGTVSVAETVKKLQEEGAEHAAAFIEKDGAPFQLEAWIDGKGLVRRMRVAETRPGEAGKGPTTVDMRTDFFDFGFEPEIEPPDSSEVFDATSLAQEQIDAAGEE